MMNVQNAMAVLDFLADHWDTVLLFGGLVWGWAWGYLKRKWQITPESIWVLRELKKCGISLEALRVKVAEVASMPDRTNAERFDLVSQWLQEAARAADIELTDNTADLIVQWVYSSWKARQKK
jgi:hypothetical protein